MIEYDEIAEANLDEKWKPWFIKAFRAQDEIAAFVSQYRQGRASGKPKFHRGSFNLCIQVTFHDGGPDAIIRFPRPGHSAFSEEKVKKEVGAMVILQRETTIPLPRLIHWGLTADSPQQLGPFIITEFVSGMHLSKFLRDPTENENESKTHYLDPNIDNEILDVIYDQVADFMLQIFQLDFNRIGAISQQPGSNAQDIERPLTYGMNELATLTGYPINEFSTKQFKRVTDYFEALTNQHMTHLWTQRNIAYSPASAKALYIARHQFPKLISQYCIDDEGPFKLFCEDLRPGNMLMDPKTLRITAVLDFEFTNSMPAQFASDPPWWLLLVGPDTWLQRGRTMGDFIAAYEPRKDQFIKAIERAEARSIEAGTTSRQSLSRLMRESWDTKRFWFDYAVRKPLDIDDLFYRHLNVGGGADAELLDDAELAGLEPFIKVKMEQLAEYKRDRTKYFEAKEQGNSTSF